MYIFLILLEKSLGDFFYGIGYYKKIDIFFWDEFIFNYNKYNNVSCFLLCVLEGINIRLMYIVYVVIYNFFIIVL